MTGENAERYYSRRVRRLAEDRARREEWDFLASRLSRSELIAEVGPGWRRLVVELHERLLTVDPSYRLYSVAEELGGLVVIARFAPPCHSAATRLLQAARAAALATCELCGRDGTLRAERVQLKTLCHDCWRSDRAAAATRGERYADAALAQLLSADEDHPSPEEIVAWLDELDAS